MANQRIDWTAFFVQFACPHGVRIRLPGIPAGAPEGLRTEKRLVRIIKARVVPAVPFALRRSMSSGPEIVDCVFAMAALADELAQEIGAVPVEPPSGWATGRELLADDQAVRLLWKMGSEACLPRLGTPRAGVGRRRPDADGDGPSKALRGPA